MATELRDLLGNPIVKGSLVWWTEQKALAKILDIQDGKLTLGLAIGFEVTGNVTHLKDFIVPVNPEEQRAALEMTKEQARMLIARSLAGSMAEAARG